MLPYTFFFPENLTNGDLKDEEMTGGFSPGDSPVSISPPVFVSDINAEPDPPSTGLLTMPIAASKIIAAEVIAPSDDSSILHGSSIPASGLVANGLEFSLGKFKIFLTHIF